MHHPDESDTIRNVAARFRQLGWGQPAATVYIDCLLRSPRVVEQVMQATRLRRSQVTTALDRLGQLRLIAHDDNHGTKQWFAIDPRIAWGALRDQITWERVNVLGSHISPLAEKQVDGEVLFLRNLCEEVGQYSSRLYRPYLPDFRRHARNVQDPEELAMLQCLAIQAAESQIVSVSPSPRLPQLAPVWNSLLAARARGVEYWRIADLIEVIEHGLAIVHRDIAEVGVVFMVLEHERLHHRFYVVDDVLAVIYHRVHDPQEHMFAGKLTGEIHEVQRYKSRFDAYRDDAIPGHFVIEQLRAASQEILRPCKDRYDSLGEEWIRRIIDMGVYARFTDLTSVYERDIKAIEKWARRSGIIAPGSWDHPVPVYPIGEADIRAAWRQTLRQA